MFFLFYARGLRTRSSIGSRPISGPAGIFFAWGRVRRWPCA